MTARSPATRGRAPQPDLVGVAAQFLAQYGDDLARRAMLAAHVPDVTGRCRAQYSADKPSPVWPCILHIIGVEAERLVSKRFSRSRRRTPRSRR